MERMSCSREVRSTERNRTLYKYCCVRMRRSDGDGDGTSKFCSGKRKQGLWGLELFSYLPYPTSSCPSVCVPHHILILAREKLGNPVASVYALLKLFRGLPYFYLCFSSLTSEPLEQAGPSAGASSSNFFLFEALKSTISCMESCLSILSIVRFCSILVWPIAWLSVL